VDDGRTSCARWYSLTVLLRVYATYVGGGEQAAPVGVARALGEARKLWAHVGRRLLLYTQNHPRDLFMLVTGVIGWCGG
jgi:hypothetical protein